MQSMVGCLRRQVQGLPAVPGSQGMIAIQTTARNGKVVAAALVTKDDEVMLISTGGVLIRTKVKSIREMSRSTQGVTLINLSGGEKLAGLERVVDLVGLLDQVGLEGSERLRPVPRTALGGQQALHDLDETRERLAARFGVAASLTLRAAEAGGVDTVIELPA